MRRKKPISITDVARESGVSIATVSRVLNNFGNVAETTRKAVMDAIEKCGYEPCHKSPDTQAKSDLVLVLMPEPLNDIYKPFIEGMYKAAETMGLSPMLVYTYKDAEREKHWFQYAMNQHFRGIVLTSTKCEAAEIRRLSRQIPVVQCYDYVSDTGVAVICVDDEHAGYNATEYLIAKGHRRIAILSATERSSSAVNRERGYRRALLAAGLKYDPNLVFYAPYRYEENEPYVREALQHIDQYDAIFCIGDMLALRVVELAREKKLQVPEDLSVIGFDNLLTSSIVSPKLTTVSQNHLKIGYYAMKSIYDQLQLGESLWGGITSSIEHSIVERESVADVNEA